MKPLQLSEAIRLGSTMIKDDRRLYLGKWPIDAINYCGCALGAAAFALGLRNGTCTPGFIITNFPIASLAFTKSSSLFHEISHWHQNGIMTREQIADKVEELEKLHPELCVKEKVEEIIEEELVTTI